MLGRHDAIEDVVVHAGTGTGARVLRGTLGVPQGPVGLVVVAGIRDILVTEALRARGLATLSLEIAATGTLADLASDMQALTEHVLSQSPLAHLPLGYLGGDVYAAAAVIAAARRPDLVRSIVAFGGRIDLAGDALSKVRAPTMFITGRDDTELIERDREAIEMMTAPTQLAIMPGAFANIALLDDVVQLASEWLIDHFAQALSEPVASRGSWGRQFRDRRNAGARLAEMLQYHAGANTHVFALSRGGVIVADEVARLFTCPLDVWLVRKIGMPIQPELGMGALAEGAALLLDPTIVRWSGATTAEIRELVHRKAAEIRRRAQLYRGDGPPPDVRGKIAILVDDGITTGGTLRAAIKGARKRGASRVVVAAPVASAEAVELLRGDVDELVALATPRHMVAVSGWYQDYRAVSESEVRAVLASARERHGTDGQAA